jgi:dienelactone hydrolase
MAQQVARIEVHPIQSMTLSDEQFLTGHKSGTPVTLAGQLRIPRPGAARVPAVVLLHGSGGISAREAEWEQDLNAMGVATFTLDSFSGRGLVNTSTDQAQLGRLAMIVDAYRALEMLEKHPRIEPGKIALMGFSRGGQAALYASVKRFHRMHGPASGREFAGYVVFYGNCGTRFIADDEVAAKPMRLLHGAADNYVPVAPCRDYVERLKGKGANISLTEYGGAHHAFDNRGFKKAVVNPKAQTTRQCTLQEAERGVIVNAKTKQVFSYADPCVEYGPTVLYDEKAHDEARKAVAAFVDAALRAEH